jgi:hypothetical protein
MKYFAMDHLIPPLRQSSKRFALADQPTWIFMNLWPICPDPVVYTAPQDIVPGSPRSNGRVLATQI